MKDTLYCRRIPAPLDSGMAAALLPADPAADAALAKIDLGEIVTIRLVKDRSSPQNRLWHALLDHVAQTSGWDGGEALGQFVKVALGHYDIVRAPSGKALAVPKSTSFDSMSHEEFCQFFEKGVALICRDLLGGMNPEDLIVEVCTAKGLPHPDTVASRDGSAPGAPTPLGHLEAPGATLPPDEVPPDFFRRNRLYVAPRTTWEETEAALVAHIRAAATVRDVDRVYVDSEATIAGLPPELAERVKAVWLRQREAK